MAQVTPLELAKQLQLHVVGLLSHIDLPELPKTEQRLIRDLKHTLGDVRLEIRDYELAETRVEQIKCAADARESLAQIQASISSNGISVFGAVDVAHVTARVEQIIDELV